MFVCETRILESDALVQSYSEEDLELKHGDFISVLDQSNTKLLAQVRNSPTWSEVKPEDALTRITDKVSDPDVRTSGWRFLLPVRVFYTAELAWVPVQSTDIWRGTRLVVKTEHGNELATSLERPLAIRSTQQHPSEMPLIRLASDEDLERAKKNEEQSQQAPDR